MTILFSPDISDCFSCGSRAGMIVGSKPNLQEILLGRLPAIPHARRRDYAALSTLLPKDRPLRSENPQPLPPVLHLPGMFAFLQEPQIQCLRISHLAEVLYRRVQSSVLHP